MILKAIAKLIGKPNTVSSTDSENIKYFQDAEKGDIFYAKYNSHIFVYRGNKWEFVDEWLDRDASRYFSEILFKRSKSDIVKENDLKKNKIPLLNKKWANEQINKLLPTGKNNLIIEFNKNENNYFQYLNETTVFFVKYGKFLFSIAEKDKEWKYVDSATTTKKFLNDLYLNRTQTKKDLMKSKIPSIRKLSEKDLKKIKVQTIKDEVISNILLKVL